MEGLTATLARIEQIQARTATLTPPLPAPATVSFAQRLATATAERACTTSPAAGGPQLESAAWSRTAALTGSSPVARLDDDGVPVELAAYGNGKVPPAALSPIGRGGHRLWAPAAESFTRMTAAAARDGVTIGVTDSYRSYDAQVELAQRKGLYSQGGLAAKPGTSDHGWGRSLDLDLDTEAQKWMRAHGQEYGFVEDTPREPWHWTFSPARTA